MAKPVRLLLVEDDKDTVNMFREMLNGIWPDWVIDDTGKGEDAIRRVKEQAPDAMILDIALLDEVDGIQVVKRIHRECAQKPPIFLITALGTRPYAGPMSFVPWMDQLTPEEKTLVAGFWLKPFIWRDFCLKLGNAVGADIPPIVHSLSA